jgi:membrane-associated phospholipid phosphatase
MKKQAFCVVFSFYTLFVFGQSDTSYASGRSPAGSPDRQKIYQLKPVVDVPVTVIGTGWSLFAFTKIYSKDTSTAAQILALNKNKIAGINRFGVRYYSPKALNASNMFFYGSMPVPFLLLFDRSVRRDAAKVGLLWAESMSITGLLYTGSVYFHDKYRPYTYNPNVDLVKRTRGGGKNSFFAGHVALVGTSTFFTAKVLADYHPNSRAKWVFFSVAGLATAATGYLRFRAGEHFLTDILIGAAEGTLTGILVPHFHKTKYQNPRISLTPFYGTQKGLALSYKL